MFQRLGALTARRPLAIAAFWLALAAGLHSVAPRWNDVTHDGDLAYLPETLPSVEGDRLLKLAFPQEEGKSQLAVVVERPGAPLSTADLAWSDSLAEVFRQRQSELPIDKIWNRHTDIIGDKLTSRISRRGQASVTLLHVKNEFMALGNVALIEQVQAILAEAEKEAPPDLNIGISGSAAVGGDMLRSAAESIKNTELATVVLVVLILLLVYRAPLLVLIPLVTIGVALFISVDVLALLTQVSKLEGFSWWNFKVFTTTKIFIVVILFGAGTDFCLFLISRYKEELERGLGQAQATAEAVSKVGEALLASAMTTICGLGMMFFADFGKFRNSGPAIALCLLVTLVACLTLAPALLRVSGRAVFWPWGLGTARSRPADEARAASRFWEWASRAILKQPGLILVVSVLAMAPLAYYGSSLRLTYDFLNELEPDCPSVQGARLARRHFASGELAPITLLAFKDGGHFNEPEGERAIARLTKQLHEMDGIESVRSLSEPAGDPPGYFQPFRSSGLKKMAARKHKQSKATFLTQVPQFEGDIARFELVLRDDPFSPAAVAMLDRLDGHLAELRGDRNSAWHDTKFTYVGTTVGIRDLSRVTQSDQTLIQQLVLIAVLAVILAILRRPLVCCYLVLSVLFSYYVTIGATQLYFSWLYGDTFHGLDWKVPIFLFVILIAVGQDYNIYLVTRVFEEQQQHGAREGLRRAIARTGGIITSCGVIMAGTFISMMTGSLRGMLELGFALSLGVMLDTCVVRPILVPAFLALLQRKATEPDPPATLPTAPHEPLRVGSVATGP